MAKDTPRISDLLKEDDFLNLAATTESFEKTLNDIQDIIECRADIFMQKKEKHQKILDHQMMKLESEKNEYINKSKALINDLGKSKSQLMQIEHSYFNLKNKLSSEKDTNRILKEKINHLQLDSKQKSAMFNKTAEIYSTVISWYKDYLNIALDFDKENFKIITITKGNNKDFENAPFIKLEILDNKKFRVVEMHPSMEEDNRVTENVIEGHQIILFLQKFQKYFTD